MIWQPDSDLKIIYSAASYVLLYKEIKVFNISCDIDTTDDDIVAALNALPCSRDFSDSNFQVSNQGTVPWWLEKNTI